MKEIFDGKNVGHMKNKLQKYFNNLTVYPFKFGTLCDTIK